MYAISNSLAKAKLNEKDNLVEVTFKGYAIPQIYQETLDIIQEIGLSNKLNHWVFYKENFSGLMAAEIINYLLDWAKNGLKRFEKQNVEEPCIIQIIAKSPLNEQLKLELASGKYNLENIKIFINSISFGFKLTPKISKPSLKKIKMA